MTYYTPFIINEEEWDLIVNPPPPEDLTFVYFCLFIMFVFCPIVLIIAIWQECNIGGCNYICQFL